jgi:hypothetical protein
MCKATPALSPSMSSWYQALLSLWIILLGTLMINWEQYVYPYYTAKSKKRLRSWLHKLIHHQEMIIQLWNWDKN